MKFQTDIRSLLRMNQTEFHEPVGLFVSNMRLTAASWVKVLSLFEPFILQMQAFLLFILVLVLHLHTRMHFSHLDEAKKCNLLSVVSSNGLAGLLQALQMLAFK